MGDSGIDKDGIVCAFVQRRAIARMHRHIWILGQIVSGAGRQTGIHFAGDHVPCRSNYFGHNRRVISDAAAQVKDAITNLQIERVDPKRQGTWLAVVQMASGIDGYQNVVVELARVVNRCVGRGAGRPIPSDNGKRNLPRPGAEKLLPRHTRKSCDQSGRVEISSVLDFLGVETATLIERHDLCEYPTNARSEQSKLRPTILQTLRLAFAGITRYEAAVQLRVDCEVDAMGAPNIETARLQMIAANCELLSADLTGVDQLCAALNVTRPMDWPPEGSEYDETAIRFFLKMLSTGGERAAGWYSWYAVLRASKERAATLVGNGGFFGPPGDDGSVEIGYSVCKSWRQQRIATEIVEALLTYAWMSDAVGRVMARTARDNSPSIGVLRRSGFHEIACDESGKLKFERLRNHPIPGPQVSA